MSARRALVEAPLHSARRVSQARRAAVDPSAARRVLDENSARRALSTDAPLRARRSLAAPSRALPSCSDAPIFVAPATRALVEDVETVIVPQAFVTRHPKVSAIARNKAVWVAGLVATLSTATGAVLGGPAFVQAATTPSQVINPTITDIQRDVDIVSRDELRREVLETEQAPEPAVNEMIAPGQLPPATVDEAIAKAQSMTGNFTYTNMCLALVATFYGYTSSGVDSATVAAARVEADGQMHTDFSDIPVGALVWYDGGPVGNPYGHVAMYAGDGMVYSNGAPTGVGLIDMNEPADEWGEPLIGWSTVWLPAATK